MRDGVSPRLSWALSVAGAQLSRSAAAGCWLQLWARSPFSTGLPGPRKNTALGWPSATDSRKVSGHASKILSSNCQLPVAPTTRTLVHLSNRLNCISWMCILPWNTVQLYNKYTDNTWSPVCATNLIIFYIRFSTAVVYFPVTGKNCKYVNHMPINIMQIIVLQCKYCIYFTKHYICYIWYVSILYVRYDMHI